MKILITICARGGSKGIPGKNIKELNNIPLIHYTVKLAQQLKSHFKCKIAISTDDKSIKKVAEKANLYSKYLRPDYLATDAVGKIETIKDVLNYEETLSNLRYDYVLDLDVTSPLRTVNDIKKSFELLQANDNALNLFSVNKAERNPYFNMVEKKENGYYAIVKESKSEFLSRQSAPKVYDLNASFYWYRRVFFDSDKNNSAITDRSLIYEMPHTCFDLDNPIDFDFLDFLLKSDKLDFKI